MPETTRDDLIEALRYNSNKEGGMVEKNDEDLLEELADFMMVTSQQFRNPNLAGAIRDAANSLITNKTSLAKGGPAQQEEPMEEAPMPSSPIPQEAIR